MRTWPMGDHALLVETGDAASALSLALWARTEGVVAADVVPAARTVLFSGVPDPDVLAGSLAKWRRDAELPRGELVEIPVHYDGPDLAEVARRWRMPEDGVRETHTGLEFVVAFCGFAPGFSYLAGLPERLAMPRLETPRTAVPAGSVAIADTWCGIYPSASPGGWRLIGRTDAVLWDQERVRPALLPPGTRVRFVAAG